MVTLNDLSKGGLENKNAHEANRGDGAGCGRESGDFLKSLLKGTAYSQVQNRSELESSISRSYN